MKLTKIFKLMQSAVDCEFEEIIEVFTDRQMVVCKRRIKC